ncbi:MAG: ATP-binding protein, partial [Planctomycetia bacterium]
WSGLAGIPAVRPLVRGVDLLRPMLAVPRTLVEGFLGELRQPFRVDSTNADPVHFRNRLRNELLPLLRTRYNVGVDDALERLADLAAETARQFAAETDRLLNAALADDPSDADAVLLAVGPFREAPPLARREALRRLFERRGWPVGFIGRDDWRRTADLFDAEPPAAGDLPRGIRAARVCIPFDAVRLSHRPSTTKEPMR